MKRFVVSALLALAAACGKVEPDPVDMPVDAAPPPPVDAAPAIDAAPVIDAAPTPSPGGNAPLVLSGSGVARSATFTLSVQIGEAVVSRPVAGPTTTLAPTGAIQP